MNIVVVGAGAIGSLFGGLLSKKNNVTLLGRTDHVTAIQKKGLQFIGNTTLTTSPQSTDSIDYVDYEVDLLLLTVKSYDTISAIKQAKKLITDHSVVLSLQNGLDNIDKIKSVISSKNIIAGITTHGAFFEKPGVINHTGVGMTCIGEINGEISLRIRNLSSVFNDAGIQTTVSSNILKQLWSKAIINSSINPVTAFFKCKNGYLLQNPVLERIVEIICKESTTIADDNNMFFSYEDMISKTKEVIHQTSQNHSSMLQSIQRNKKIEIDSINGIFVEIGKKNHSEICMNSILLSLFEK